jgi:hypothetical protein
MTQAQSHWHFCRHGSVIMNDMAHCELCGMDVRFCRRSLTERRASSAAVAGQLLISPKGMAHFPGCPHKGDDADYSRWATLAMAQAWQRLVGIKGGPYQRRSPVLCVWGSVSRGAFDRHRFPVRRAFAAVDCPEWRFRLARKYCGHVRGDPDSVGCLEELVPACAHGRGPPPRRSCCSRTACPLLMAPTPVRYASVDAAHSHLRKCSSSLPERVYRRVPLVNIFRESSPPDI